MADRPIRTKIPDDSPLKFSRSIWCGIKKDVGDIIEYEDKKYKVLWCNIYPFIPAIGNGYKYYLTVSEV